MIQQKNDLQFLLKFQKKNKDIDKNIGLNYL